MKHFTRFCLAYVLRPGPISSPRAPVVLFRCVPGQERPSTPDSEGLPLRSKERPDLHGPAGSQGTVCTTPAEKGPGGYQQDKATGREPTVPGATANHSPHPREATSCMEDFRRPKQYGALGCSSIGILWFLLSRRTSPGISFSLECHS